MQKIARCRFLKMQVSLLCWKGFLSYRTLTFVILFVFWEIKSLLIRQAGFARCLLSTVVIESNLYVYSFREQVESLWENELEEPVSKMLEYHLGLVMTRWPRAKLTSRTITIYQTSASATVVKCREKEGENVGVM